MPVFHYHPHKAVKMSVGIDYVTFNRHKKSQKSTPEKISSYKHCLLVSMIKPLMTSND
jgi:hypothetical protein